MTNCIHSRMCFWRMKHGEEYCNRCVSKYERKAEWKKPKGDSCTYSDSFAQCSNCGKVVLHGYDFDYCPFCGAETKGKGEK